MYPVLALHVLVLVLYNSSVFVIFAALYIGVARSGAGYDWKQVSIPFTAIKNAG